MVDWQLFFIIFAVAAPGVVVTLPRLVAQLEDLLKEKLAEGQKRPSPHLIMLAGLVEYLLLATVGAPGFCHLHAPVKLLGLIDLWPSVLADWIVGGDYRAYAIPSCLVAA